MISVGYMFCFFLGLADKEGEKSMNRYSILPDISVKCCGRVHHLRKRITAKLESQHDNLTAPLR